MYWVLGILLGILVILFILVQIADIGQGRANGMDE